MSDSYFGRLVQSPTIIIHTRGLLFFVLLLQKWGEGDKSYQSSLYISPDT